MHTDMHTYMRTYKNMYVHVYIYRAQNTGEAPDCRQPQASIRRRKTSRVFRLLGIAICGRLVPGLAKDIAYRSPCQACRDDDFRNTTAQPLPNACTCCIWDADANPSPNRHHGERSDPRIPTGLVWMPIGRLARCRKLERSRSLFSQLTTPWRRIPRG